MSIAPSGGSQGEIEFYRTSDAFVIREKGKETIFKLKILSRLDADIQAVQLETLVKQFQKLSSDEKRQFFQHIKGEVIHGQVEINIQALKSKELSKKGTSRAGMLFAVQELTLPGGGKNSGTAKNIEDCAETTEGIKEINAQIEKITERIKNLESEQIHARSKTLQIQQDLKQCLQDLEVKQVEKRILLLKGEEKQEKISDIKKDRLKASEIPQKLSSKLSTLQSQLSESKGMLKVWTEILEVERRIQALEGEQIALQNKGADPREMTKIERHLKKAKEELHKKQIEKNRFSQE